MTHTHTHTRTRTHTHTHARTHAHTHTHTRTHTRTHAHTHTHTLTHTLPTCTHTPHTGLLLTVMNVRGEEGDEFVDARAFQPAGVGVVHDVHAFHVGLGELISVVVVV